MLLLLRSVLLVPNSQRLLCKELDTLRYYKSILLIPIYACFAVG
jgi:hypothetical protein